ncbi:MAG: tetratricopeptide repeat protein [Acidobacteria bacterium]|nr:tetratricopeptide repeat protein [Acidobacteriota bacterium]MCB9396957.1 tetratricopeptide repeat protein [Acidobacteriota bacterium]
MKPAMTPNLKWLFRLLLFLFLLLLANGLYLGSVTFQEYVQDRIVQNSFYLWMFLGHIGLGLLLVTPVLIFGTLHGLRGKSHSNQKVKKWGLSLFLLGLILLITGVFLSRFEGFPTLSNPSHRTLMYWAHVICPVLVLYCFWRHRPMSMRRRIRQWTPLLTVCLGLFFGFRLVHHTGDAPPPAPIDQTKLFFPATTRSAIGDLIPADLLNIDAYCQECHQESHETWLASAHRFSSFNNPVYRFSVEETRATVMNRDGSIQASRFCAGCHDPVPLLTGRFDDPNFNADTDPTAKVGITCTVCHGIEAIHSNRGNGEFTIAPLVQYPFFGQNSGWQAYLNRQLIKAKPGYHKTTMLRPIHKTANFCGSCHKVHIPKELNHYRWLRGQNHFDPFLLSGVSGHGIDAFYYPEKAQADCSGCHMPTFKSEEFGAKARGPQGEMMLKSHQFPAANTGLGALKPSPDTARMTELNAAFLKDVLRIDLFGLRQGTNLDVPQIAPLRPQVPHLETAKPYILEVVLRNLKTGHPFTQGTADSNQVWVDLRFSTDQGLIASSGWVGPEGNVDPAAHFINAFVLDREGRRIDRRNVPDIFMPLYNHQIPPGAADTIFFAFELPKTLQGQDVTVEARILYRKFDETLVGYMKERGFNPADIKQLPMVEICSDRLTFQTEGQGFEVLPAPEIPEWMRWNDYGIGLLRKGGKGPLKMAEAAFAQVEGLGSYQGPINLARAYMAQGRIQTEASEALERAKEMDNTPPWTLLWLSGQINRQNGNLDLAARDFERILALDFPNPRNFDFSPDYRLLNQLAGTYYDQAKAIDVPDEQTEFLTKAKEMFEKSLVIDPENLTAHYNLAQIYKQLGDTAKAEAHTQSHLTYRPDENAQAQAILKARKRYPEADRVAETLTIYPLTPATSGKGNP